MDLSLSTRTEGDRTVVEVGGEIDVYTAPKLREQLVELVNERQLPPGRRHGGRRLPRLHRPRRAGRRAQAGARPRGLAAPGLHPGAHPEDLPDHRPDQGVPDPRLGRRSGPSPTDAVSGRTARHGHRRTAVQRAARARPHRPLVAAAVARRAGVDEACSTRSGSRSARRAPGRWGCTASPVRASRSRSSCTSTPSSSPTRSSTRSRAGAARRTGTARRSACSSRPTCSATTSGLALISGLGRRRGGRPVPRACGVTMTWPIDGLTRRRDPRPAVHASLA